MIAKLRGAVDTIGDGFLILDVGGVGFLVLCSTRTLADLPNPPATVTVLTEMQVREDAITLFGFGNAAEREWFRLLTTVQGVGAKVALGLLSALSPAELATAIAAGDKAAITRAPGVGAKLALRIATELREKSVAMPGAGGGIPNAIATAPAGTADALSALLNLGYRRAEADSALARAVETHGADAPLDVLIKAGLKALIR